jgi:hypothetical protein
LFFRTKKRTVSLWKTVCVAASAFRHVQWDWSPIFL